MPGFLPRSMFWRAAKSLIDLYNGVVSMCVHACVDSIEGMDILYYVDRT